MHDPSGDDAAGAAVRPAASGLPLEGIDLFDLLGAWSVPVLCTDDAGRVRIWNHGAALLYGWSVQETLGRPWREVVGEELPTPPPEPESGTRTRRYEARHRTREGRPIDVLVTRTELWTADGAHAGEVLLLHDMTRQKARDAQLARRVAQLSVIREIGEALQSAMRLPQILRVILVGATASQGLRFNRAFLLLVDAARGEIRGRVAIGPSDAEEAHRIWSELGRSEQDLRALLRHFEPMFETGDGAHVQQVVRSLAARLADEGDFLVRALRAPATVRVESGVERESGRAVDPVLLERLRVDTFVAVPLAPEGKPVGLLLADNAITRRPIDDEDVRVLELLGMQAAVAIERAQLTGQLASHVAELEKAHIEIRANQERLLRAERLGAVGEMAARVAHEIRNPLVAIGGFARHLLASTPIDNESRDEIQIIADEARRLEAIVREVLDYSRPSPPKIAEVELGRIAGEVLELLRWEMEQAAVQALLDADGGAPRAAADRDQLLQAVLNIVQNAIHAMRGGGTLTIRVRGVGRVVEMAIEDTGVGIPDEQRSRILEPFFTTKATGSGLGLTIASQIVRDHGGEIHIESEPGSGTTVYLRLPRAGGSESHVENPDR